MAEKEELSHESTESGKNPIAECEKCSNVTEVFEKTGHAFCQSCIERAICVKCQTFDLRGDYHSKQWYCRECFDSLPKEHWCSLDLDKDEYFEIRGCLEARKNDLQYKIDIKDFHLCPKAYYLKRIERIKQIEQKMELYHYEN